MASLNTSTNGPSITKSYQSVVDAPPPSGPAAASPTYGQWAVFTVSAPLVNTFQQDTGGKESVLKVQSTGEGELVDMVEEFSDGRIQFAYVKVKDTNTGLFKTALVAWCGEGVPERTKGYFTNHLATVSKLLHGYHVQVTARSERDLTPEGLIQKIADASGSKYSASSNPPPVAMAAKPNAASKPAFTPTRSTGPGNLPQRSRDSQSASKPVNVDEDGWGEDAPPITRTQLQKVPSAYQPTKVNLNELTARNEPQPESREQNRQDDGVVKGAYQPVGKVDIAAIRRQAQESGNLKDERPETIKGSYEPVGKVDIAAIRAKAKKPSDTSSFPPKDSGTSSSNSASNKPLADRSAAFSNSERLTSLPKPRVSNQFGSSSSFAGTRAPLPGGFEAKQVPAAAPIGSASRTFADQGGKTPAQVWAEKKAREQESSPQNLSSRPPVQPQTSGGGEWKSSYTGKSWAPVQTSHTGRSATSNLDQQRAEDSRESPDQAPSSPVPGVVESARDQFSGRQASKFDRSAPALDTSNKPNGGAPLPGLPTRSSTQEVTPSMPSPPPQPPRSPTPPTPIERPRSPIQVAMPVARDAIPDVTDAHEEQMSPPPPMPARSMEQRALVSGPGDDEPDTGPDPGRSYAQKTAAASLGQDEVENAPAAIPNVGAEGSKRALVQYDYEAAEDNELELKEGEYITNIDMVDENWWMGQNASGQAGLFPANYVELVDNDTNAFDNTATPAPPSRPGGEDVDTASAPVSAGPTATALYDYEAAEDNEISFPEGAKITSVEFPDEDWWLGVFNGQNGLFPANYVQLDG